MKIKINENFSRLQKKYLFSEIHDRVEIFKASAKGERIISLGIGDVSLPLSSAVADEMARAAKAMSRSDGFRGYGDTMGDPILRKMIADRYLSRGVLLDSSEIFINDGSKSDLGNINDVLGENDTVIFDPVYPVYLDSTVISGRRAHLVLANRENNFLPLPEDIPKNISKKPLVIYICSPNNPTGAVFTNEMLKDWVDFALESGSLIIFDAAYESYITEPHIPHSIFEIEGAKSCAVEICSFSKSAGFTGVRCGWTAIASANPIKALWVRRQSTKFNGASYISQRGAMAALSKNGAYECTQNVAYYLENAKMIAQALTKKGIFFTGGKNAPYIWMQCPNAMSSWSFFDALLNRAQIVGTPGVGFGNGGEGYFRLSAFNSRENILEAMQRLDTVL